MKLKACLVAVLLVLPAPSFAQGDEIEIGKVRVYATAGDVVSAPVTCHVTSVTFTDVGFPINADCLDGPGRWPDVTPDGWDGPIQFTYCMGLQSKADNRWAVSCVVQMWHNRQQQDPNATAAPYAVDKSWFYDPRWGELKDRNPAPGETVALFVVRGNARYGTETTRPRERSNIVLVKWGQNWSGPVVVPPVEPPVVVPPGQPPVVVPPVVVPPVQPPNPVGSWLSSEQAERMFADLTAKLEESKKREQDTYALLQIHDERTKGFLSALGGFAKSPAGMALLSGLTVCVSTPQCRLNALRIGNNNPTPAAK